MSIVFDPLPLRCLHVGMIYLQAEFPKRPRYVFSEVVQDLLMV